MTDYYIFAAACFLAGFGAGIVTMLGVAVYLKWTEPDATTPRLILPTEE